MGRKRKDETQSAYNVVSWGKEPTWEGKDLLKNPRIQLGLALNWYSIMSTDEQQKKWFLDYISDKVKSEVYEKIETISSKTFRPFGGWVRMTSRGATIPDFNEHYKRILNKLLSEVPDRTKDKTIRQCNSTYLDPVSEKVVYDLDKIISAFYRKKPNKIAINASDLFLLYDATAKHQKQVATLYKSTLSELDAIIAGNADNDLKESYSVFSTRQIQAFYDFLKSIETYQPVAVEKTEEKVQKVRKPRRKKIKSAEKILQKFKYRQSSAKYKVQSVSPKDFLGAKQLVIFHEDRRILGVFNAKDDKGLTVSGSSIRNYDEETSYCKTLRKPEEVLPNIMQGTKASVKQCIKGVNSMDRTLRSSITEETLLLRVF